MKALRYALLLAGLVLAVSVETGPAQAGCYPTPGAPNAATMACQTVPSYVGEDGVPVPVSVANPLPTTSGGGPSGGEVDLTGINGVAPLAGAGLTGTGSPRVTQSAAAPTSSSALAANTVVCGAACRLASFNVAADSTLSGAAWWIMIYNATTAPSDGAVAPVKCYAMPSGSTSIAADFSSPLNLTTGAVIGVSTTGCFTKTASTHAFISGDSQ